MLFHHFSEAIVKWLDGYYIESILVSTFSLILLFIFGIFFDPIAIESFFSALVILSPLWLPIFLLTVFWIGWIHYVRYIFWFTHDNILLEIQLPQEVEKSPLAMEAFLLTLWNAGGEATFLRRAWGGSFRHVFSFEIASNEGRVSYYIHMRREWRNIVEARMYGYFPEAKIIEVEDYAAKVPFNVKEYSLFGSEYAKGSKNPQALPIKTYIDFGMDKDPKEEYKIDPLAHILELLAQVGKGEYYWFQIITRARKADEWYAYYTNKDKYREPALEEIKKIMAGAAQRAKAVIAENDITEGKTSLLTDGEKRRIDAIERALTKQIFECGFRVLYLAKNENFNGINIPQLIRFFTIFSGAGYEHNQMGVTTGSAFFDFPWQDYKNYRRNLVQEEQFFHYKHRAYFYVPYDQEPVFMNVEELATLWHFPSSSIKTPGLNRVASQRSAPPPNLPIARS